MVRNYGGYEQNEFVAEFYDLIYENRKDIDFFVDISRKAGGKTLELGCGTGRILIPAAVTGCEITGLEISPYMLIKCREKLDMHVTQVKERVKLIQCDMTDFQTDELYNLVMAPFRSFQHLISIEEQKNCLNCTNKHLVNNGLLVLDMYHTIGPRMYHPSYTFEQELVASRKLPDGRSVRCTTRIAAFHRDKQYNDTEIIYYISNPDGRTERSVQSFPLRYFFRYEVEHLLNSCGFRIVEIYGDYNGSKYTQNSPEMIIIAEKL